MFVLKEIKNSKIYTFNLNYLYMYIDHKQFKSSRMKYIVFQNQKKWHNRCGQTL